VTDLNLRDTITPNSQQLNADDLIGTKKTITVTKVTRGDSPEQPVSIHYEGDDGRPYKPCKSMRRVLIHCWGDDGHAWVGKSMQLYCDPEVKFGGVKVGGIRIRALSGIDGAQQLSLTVTRSKRQPYRVDVLKPAQRPAYPADLFAEKLPVILETIEAGKMTPEQAIARLEQTGTLTDEQRARVREGATYAAA
jgi:hypothetical protein